MATLLKKMAEDRAAHEERLRLAMREDLKRALHEILPGTAVIVFGSLTRVGRF
jgi:hypothetical protein